MMPEERKKWEAAHAKLDELNTALGELLNWEMPQWLL